MTEVERAVDVPSAESPDAEVAATAGMDASDAGAAPPASEAAGGEAADAPTAAAATAAPAAPGDARGGAGGKGARRWERPKWERPEDVVIPPRPEKVSAPDEAAFAKLTADLEEQIQKARQVCEEIRGKFSHKDSSRDQASQQRTAVLEKLKEAQKATRAKADEVNALREEMKSMEKLRDAVIAEETKMKAQLKITDLRVLERRVAEIDEKLVTETLSLTAEKKLIAEREQLTSSKPAILAYQAKRDEIGAKKAAVEEVFQRMRAARNELDGLRDAEKKLRDEFEALKAKQAESAKAAPSIGDELRAAKDRRDALVAQLKSARDDYYKQLKAYREYENQLKAYNYARRQKEYLLMQQERKQREEAYKAEQEAFDPLAAKRELCFTIIAALQRMQTDSSPATAAAPEQVELPSKLGGKEGKFYQPSTKFSQQTFSFAKSKAKPAEKPAEQKKTVAEPLRLPIKLLSQFSELHLTPPALTTDIPNAIEALRKKAEFFAAESQKAQAKAAAAKAAAAASAATASAAPGSAPSAESATPADGADDGPTPPASTAIEA